MSRLRPAEISRRIRDAFGGLMIVLSFGLVLTLILTPRETFVSPAYAATDLSQGEER